MKTIYIKIEGMHCINCENKIRLALLKEKNIKNIDFKKNIAVINYKDSINYESIIKAINDLEYKTSKEYINEDIKLLKEKNELKDFFIIFSSIILIIFILNNVFNFNIFNIIPTIDSNITYGMLIITGLLTSIHCISMCGAFNLMAAVNKNSKRNLKKPILYNTGRVLSYTIVGGIVGLIGSAISINNIFSGLIIMLSAIVMLAMSLSMLKIITFKLPKVLKIKNKSSNSFVIGLLNGFMPCGPLQAMQFYALSTGSLLTGALSMFLFGLGTVPLMLLMGIMVNVLNSKKRILMNKIASVLILVLSLIMFNRSLLILNVDVFKYFNNNKNFISSKISDEYQIIEFDLSYAGYKDIILKKDIPVKMIINVKEKHLTGCNNEFEFKDFNIVKKLEVGENIIEFTPTKTGTFTYACWMNMLKNNIKVIN